MNRKRKLLTGIIIAGAFAGGSAEAASSPTVSTGSTSSITTSSAVLHGTVNPNGASTTYNFQWGLTKLYGLTSSSMSVKSGTKSVSVQTTISHLLPGTVYHYRIAALNKSGGGFGADRTFKTAGNPPPDAATGPASAVGTNSAAVSAVINPHGQKTTWVFQFGPTTSYLYQTFGGTVPAGNVPVAIAEQLTELESGTTFHYRVVALHGSSVVETGNDFTFVTLPSPRPVPRIKAKTSPGRAHKKPYVFKTSGTVVASSRFPASLQCLGTATVRYLLGKRSVSFNVAPVAANCTFSVQTTFNHKPGKGPRPSHEKLRVEVGFRGNGYLAPSTARSESVTLG